MSSTCGKRPQSGGTFTMCLSVIAKCGKDLHFLLTAYVRDIEFKCKWSFRMSYLFVIQLQKNTVNCNKNQLFCNQYVFFVYFRGICTP